MPLLSSSTLADFCDPLGDWVALGGTEPYLRTRVKQIEAFAKCGFNVGLSISLVGGLHVVDEWVWGLSGHMRF